MVTPRCTGLVMESSLLIRDATFDDVAAINQIYNEAVGSTTATFDTQPKTILQQETWFRRFDERYPIIVAEERDVVGWSCLQPWSPKPAYDKTAETTFYVAASHRGRGIGRELKRETIERARRLGYHTLLARVVSESEASLHLNQSFGFELVGTMKQVGYKFDRWLDVHLMQLLLT